MPIRNPFARRPGGATLSEDHAITETDAPHPGFVRVDTVGSKASSAVSIRSSRSQDNGEYKMSVVNDSGVYLPPSPTEDKAQWPRRYLSSRTSSETRSSIGDIEPFSISRESFDSYRRSFDVSARAPIVNHDTPARQSLDSARFPRVPRSAIGQRIERQPPTAEEGFEEVGLDDQKHQHQQNSHAQAPRKRGFFSKFSEPTDKDSPNQAGVSRFLGRKRGQSGQGAELGSIDHPRVMVTSEE